MTPKSLSMKKGSEPEEERGHHTGRADQQCSARRMMIRWALESLEKASDETSLIQSLVFCCPAVYDMYAMLTC